MDRVPNELVSQQRGWLTLVAVTLALAVLAAWVTRERHGLLPGEWSLRAWVFHHPLPPKVRRIVFAFVGLGRPRVACATVLLCAIAATSVSSWRAGLLIGAASLVVLPARALKAWARHRTVPSGHVAYAVSLFGMTGCVLLQQSYPLAAFSVLLAGLAMGPARVLDNGHWALDIVAGYAIGLAWLLGLLVLGFSWAVPAQ